ncbi:MAG: type II secretion system protein GspG [Acidobacteriota bacterium]
MRKTSKGFTLIELLIVVAIIGIIAAIAIPNLLNAIQRGKQKRTTGDMRTVATAIESYSIDNNQYPILASGEVSEIETFLEPTYIKAVPTLDGWRHPFLYVSTLGQEYQITSYGKDNTASGPTTGTTTDFRHDIVFDTGSFTVVPEGTQG